MRPPPLVLVPQFFGSLVFDRRTSRYYPFDREATAILLALRTKPIESVAAGREGVLAFYERFDELGFFRPDGRLAARALELEVPSDHLAGPLAVHLEIVAACNLACRHCFAGDLPRRVDRLTLREMDRLFEELAAMGSFRLGLTGGEPLLAPDLLEILDRATSRGLHPCLATNGLLLDEEMARELGRRERVRLSVSLEGATAAANDAIRGPGVFDRVLERVAVLRRHAPFAIAFTLTRANAAEVEACARLARDLGAHAAVFRPLYPVGVARRHPELLPSYREYVEALERLVGEGDLRAIDPFAPGPRPDSRARILRTEGCGAGNLVASISAGGDVSPCSFLGPESGAGNLRERPFAEIWRESRGFRTIRGLEGGGCRARALFRHGSIEARDPWYDEWLAERVLHPLASVEAG